MRRAARPAAQLAMLLAATALASGCGSDNGDGGGGGMGEAATAETTTDDAPGTTVTVVETGEATTVPSEAPLSSLAFQTPSRNIGCLYSPEFATLRCDILSGLEPEPEAACELDWTGSTLERVGRATPQCAGDTVYDSGSPILRYGDRWRRGGLTCVSRETGLRCTNEQGHGFVLSRARSRAF